jgi:hypothetical protein
VGQPIQRLFFALAAANEVYGGDATNAFANSPPPDTPLLSKLTKHTPDGMRIDLALSLVATSSFLSFILYKVTLNLVGFGKQQSAQSSRIRP